ncbi:peptidoglycan DD-metalloendopeptidase family protein [Staphylococcus pettenkoferi]|uniref:peptidoglycan DD-metalloendopeptidase family protein n=1 Tax=Staphylococcus pettenkoferi TaxID=170573 RepID=UPI000B5156E3|nr:peptidoglycan DD-metalloendopeptidase family protein [Staphylococcus pettenkoferi]ASE37793.1 phage tail tape measure protein [Staphylococcus pettenkoferi]
MAERIKGLQIDLSLKDMNVAKSLSGIKREFRDLNSTMKLSANNFKYTEKSASSYKTRLNDLDKGIKAGTANLKQLEKQYKEVSEASGTNSAKAVRLHTEYNKQADAVNRMRAEYSKLNKVYRENYTGMGIFANKMDKVGSGMQKAGNQITNVGQSLSSKITKPALVAGTAMAGITAKLGFDRLVGLDTAKAKLEGLGYSTKEVGTITDQVTHAIKGGMTTMAEGTDVAAGALAAGVKQGKDLEHYIKLVGDAAVGANRPVSDMAMIFNRVQGQGKLATEELNMVEEGMPGFANAMAKHLNVSQEEFRNMVTEGKVSAKEFMDVMDDFAGGMAGAYAKSWQGMVQNTKAYIGIIGENLLSGVFKESKKSLNEFEKLLSSPGAQKWASDTGETLGNALTKLVNGIKGVVNWWQGLNGSTQHTLGGIAKWLGILLVTTGPVLTITGKLVTSFGKMFSGAATLTKGIIRASAWMKKFGLLSKISAAAQGIWNGVVATARGIANAYRFAVAALSTSQLAQSVKAKIAAVAQGIWNGVVSAGRGIANAYRFAVAALATGQVQQAIKTKLAAVATKFWTGVTKAATLATKGLGLAIRFMTGPIGIAITIITALVAAIIYLWKNNKGFRDFVINAWTKIKEVAISVFGAIKNFILGTWNSIKTGTTNSLNALKRVIITIISIYVKVVRTYFRIIKTVIVGTWNAVKRVTSVVWNAIKKVISAIVGGIVGSVRRQFTLMRKIITTIFHGIRALASKIWQTIRNTVVNKVKSLVNGVKRFFTALSKSTRSIFNAIGGFLSKKWSQIKNLVVNKVKALFNGVKNWFNKLGKNTRSIMNSIGGYMSKKWNSIKNGTVNKAKALGSGVKGAWSRLSKSTHSTMNSVGGFMSKKWGSIKSNTVKLANGLKSGVTGAMSKMKGTLSGIIGKVKGLFGSMVKSVANGLNKLIKGVNWVGDKLGMDKLPELKLSTGTTHTTTHNVVTNGKVNRDTFATVGDRGRGNGPRGFRHEMIRYPNGKTALTPNRDTTTFLPKGSSVINGKQTHSILSNLPKFASGTSKKNFVQAMGDKAGKFFSNPKKQSKNALDTIGGKSKEALEWGESKVDQIKSTAGKGIDWLKKTVGDIEDYVEHPGKLLDKVFQAFGVNMNAFGIPKLASLPHDMMAAMFKKIKNAAISFISDALDDFGGGEGSNPFAGNKNFHWVRGWSPSGHAGIDYSANIGTRIPSTINGKVIKAWHSPWGGGNETQVYDGNKYTHIFMHQSRQKAKTGQRVKEGQTIGYVGSTGNSTGPHVHWQVNKGKGFLNNHPDSINPLEWVKKAAKGGKVGGSGSANARAAIKRAQSILGGRYKSSYITEQMMRVAKRESNFTADAQNNWDSNAQAGTPSKGMFQMIVPSFKAYAKPGHRNILNPTDEAISAMRYIVGKWVPIMGSWRSAFKRAGDYAYKTGGMITNNGLYNLADGGYPEFVIPTDPARQSDAMKLLAIAAEQIGGDTAGNKRPKQLRSPNNLGGSDDQEVVNMLARQLEATQQQVDLLTQLVASSRRIEEQPKGFNEREVSKAQGKRARMMAYNMGGAF